jgi:hypothetical protein
LTVEREKDLARSVPRLAARRLAADAFCVDAAHAMLDEARPHALVDATRALAPDDERPKRTRRRRKFRAIAVERDDGDLKTERSERIAHALESGPEIFRWFQAAGRREPATEVLPGFAERPVSAASGNPRDQEADQLCQTPVGELDAFEFRRDAIDLGRTSGTGPAPSAPALESDGEEARLGEPVEPAACDVAMDAERRRCLSGRKRIAAAARVHENLPEPRIARRCKTVERHSEKPTWRVSRESRTELSELER